RDQRLVKELVAGVTRLRRRLDFVVANLTQQTPADMESGVRQVLRLGVYELTERRLAPYALNEHVQLAKVVSGPGAGSFVNGVLRSAARQVEAGTLPTPEVRPLRLLALQHSHPNWLVSRWLSRFGRQGTEALLRRNNMPPIYTVRVNTLRAGASVERLLGQLAAVGVEAEASPLMPTEFIRIRSGLQKLLAEGFVSDGSLVVQDESAGLVVSLLDPQPGERLLDCCAAPGGKTLFAAARMRGHGSITALDVSAPRLGALRRAAELAGVEDMVTTRAVDLRRRVRQPDTATMWQYDKVLLDAPCTGTGVLAKRADLRWRRTPEQLYELVALQQELLEAAACLVAPGGVLVYSTCDIEEEEDQERVRTFLERHPEFEVEPAAAAAVPSGRRGFGASWVPPSVVTAEGFMATLPHVHDTDGAFAARLRR
ncbi:hypothetical protein VOLCADRAFT_42105, partial [Volvox carteri f. nagariensis]